MSLSRSEIGWAVGSAAVAGAIVVGLPVWVSSDSVAYVSMARSLHQSLRLDLWDGQACGWWPPGYSALLSLASPPLGRVPGWLPGLNAVLAALAAMAATQLSRNLRPPLRVVAVGGILGSAATLSVMRAYLSDGLFLVLWIWLLVALDRSRAQRSPTPQAVVLAALLPLVRSVGVSAWVAVGWSLWVAVRRGRVDARRGGAAVVVMTAPFLGWGARNLLVLGSALPSYPGQPRDFEGTLRRSIEVLAGSWVPRVGSTDLLIASFGLGAIALLLWTRRPRESWPAWGRRLVATASTDFVLVAILAFLAIFLYGSATRLVDRPDPRLLAPLIVGGWVLVLRSLRSLDRGPRSRCAATLAMSLWMVHSWVGARPEFVEGIPKADVERRSLLASTELAREIVRELEEFEPAGEVLSTNVPALVYWLSGRPASWDRLLRSPGPNPRGTPERIYYRQEFVRPFLRPFSGVAEGEDFTALCHHWWQRRKPAEGRTSP